jgi:prepilin-type processing-associated H-X9-DG protein
MATAVDAVKEYNKGKVGKKVVSVNGEPVRHMIRHYGGVDVLFADGTQTRFAADDKVSVSSKDSDESDFDKVITGSPLGARGVDERVEADNEKSLEDAKKASNSAKKASKKKD